MKRYQNDLSHLVHQTQRKRLAEPPLQRQAFGDMWSQKPGGLCGLEPTLVFPRECGPLNWSEHLPGRKYTVARGSGLAEPPLSPTIFPVELGFWGHGLINPCLQQHLERGGSAVSGHPDYTSGRLLGVGKGEMG